jgi:hypothetical protein
MCITPGNPEYTLHWSQRPLPLIPKRICASLAAVSVLAGPASHAHPVASKRPPVPTPGHYADAHPDLFVRILPVLSDGLGVCVGRSALSTTEPAEDPSCLSPPHAPAHIHVSPRTTLPPAPACGVGIIACGWRGEKVAVSVARL